MQQTSRANSPTCRSRSRQRSGKILVALAVLLPSAVAICGLVLDGSQMTVASRRAQQVADAAATAAAAELRLNGSGAAAVVSRYVHDLNGLTSATVTTHVPPQSGEHAGNSRFVEVILQLPVKTNLMGLTSPVNVRARAVAGYEAVTAPAALVILDPSPPTINVLALPILLPSVTPLLGGLEVLGLGAVNVHGAVLVNNEWGGFNEDWEQVGEASLRHACTCTPILPLTRLRATDIRVTGGVCNPNAYRGLEAGKDVLTANRHPVPDPYRTLPPPTTAVDSSNVSAVYHGTRTVIGIPLIGLPTVLQPGVYDWITVVSGRVIFQPGVYIIRGKHPLTQIGLTMLAGQIEAEGVMFYLTDTTSYSAGGTNADHWDGEISPGNPGVLNLLPSALIDLALPGSSFSGLNSPGSPYHGMIMMQRRHDRRPILLVKQSLLGGVSFRGNIYAKWGHVVIAGQGLFRSAIAAGSLRILDVLNCEFQPDHPLPAATDVFLVE